MTVSTDADGLDLALCAGDRIVGAGVRAHDARRGVIAGRSIGRVSAFAYTSFGDLTPGGRAELGMGAGLCRGRGGGSAGIVPRHVSQVGPMIEQA
jgi:hypothetical protein